MNRTAQESPQRIWNVRSGGDVIVELALDARTVGWPGMRIVRLGKSRRRT